MWNWKSDTLDSPEVHLHARFAITLLAIFATLVPAPPGLAVMETRTLARLAAVLAGRAVAVDCRLEHRDDRATDRFAPWRDTVTLELTTPDGDADGGSRAPSIVIWRLESQSLAERTMYEQTLRATCAQFTEGRVRLVLSWIGSLPPRHQFVRVEVFDLALDGPPPAELGPKRAFARRSHEPIAVLQRRSGAAWSYTGESEVLMSPSLVQIRLVSDTGPAPIFEYHLRRQQWFEISGAHAPVVGEEPFADPSSYWQFGEPSPPGAPPPEPPRGFVLPARTAPAPAPPHPPR